ncbi:hypothetical protein MKW98_001238 [Papaver atlanticum]|uniref:DNA endonuclease activator Ctp1 C-terminal domain-containing protein n=1 Tax=Papaver atlanticum TaxID=357466 RepID=A0AAD4STG4_9MAGN|nr:hypothetical protein MKW98_001238 [Papaver atlanticum]
MEYNLEISPNVIGDDDGKSYSQLSTVLVATIQEVKDRVSQIEFIFCSQLFPGYKARTKSLHKRYIEAKKAAEEKESCLRGEIDELRLEQKHYLEERERLIASFEEEKEKLIKQKMKAKEDEWRSEEYSLRHHIDVLELEKQKIIEEKRNLVASLEQEKTYLRCNNQLLDDLQNEKKLLLAKVESLEKKEDVAELQRQVKRMNEELAEEKRLHEKLRQQIELKDYEMILEKKRNRNIVDSFKRLRSQHNFLRSKCGLSTDNMIPSNSADDNINSSRNYQNPRIPTSPEGRNPEPSRVALKTNKQKDETSLTKKLGNNKMQFSSYDTTTKVPSTSRSSQPFNCPANMKSEPLSGIQQQPLPNWRATRSRQEPGGADPHDDFLDTPLENIQDNITRGLLREETHDFPVLPPKDMDLDNSDDETQDLNGEPAPQKQKISIMKPPNDRGFKYVEPVRKKADRENLKGIECKQCKKFYDAVLPGGDQNNNNLRCEHHDGVSRHRYRFIPPSTPEGFWNIGFDSEM